MLRSDGGVAAVPHQSAITFTFGFPAFGNDEGIAVLRLIDKTRKELGLRFVNVDCPHRLPAELSLLSLVDLVQEEFAKQARIILPKTTASRIRRPSSFLLCHKAALHTLRARGKRLHLAVADRVEEIHNQP